MSICIKIIELFFVVEFSCSEQRRALTATKMAQNIALCRNIFVMFVMYVCGGGVCYFADHHSGLISSHPRVAV